MSGGSSVGVCGCSVVRSCFNLLQGDSVSSALCSMGVSVLFPCFYSLAGGQWFIGSVFVSMSGRYGGNIAMWLGVSLRPCFYSLQVIKR